MEVEQCDKGGNFIGWLYHEGKNLSTVLVAEGLSKVLSLAERSTHAKDLFEAQEKAKVDGKKLWKVSCVTWFELKDEGGRRKERIVCV